MRKKSIKILSLLLTLVFVLGLLPGMSLTAYAAETSESFTTNQQINTYTGEHFTISCQNGGDNDGFVLNNNFSAIISARNGETITKVEFTRGFYMINSLRSATGDVTYSGDVATVSNVNATSLTVNALQDLQIKAVKVYYNSSYTVTYVHGEGTGEDQKFNAIDNGQGGYKHDIEKCEDNFTAPEGKHFDHWDDGKGHTYKTGDTINPVTENITLTAIWVDNSQGGGSHRGSGSGADLVFGFPGASDGGWEYVGGSVPQQAYRLSFAPMEGGSAAFLLNSGENGETMNVYPQTTVRVIPTPAPGYRLASIIWSMIDGSASYDITEAQNFIMPAMDVVVYVTFQPIA